ncbi:DUF2958 domain-containing protein [Chelativorans salis]|uniref:DUF2958 domain-containing protein n=1 Tax=Chelativorans salis TaxID=2978478 RepID=A0ABT2LYG1_9HYPH|nr:DUF2958 domain-containing protein [Chelativorans sp. EGI FJ00035]MCT7378244.1 DUF2958 domain-containing protein [Chelativorans sp. EGI FJ00035]
MMLITDDIRTRLLENGAGEAGTDHLPVVKLFDPAGSATWLITEMMPDGDTLFGLCDPGFGTPELGTVSLAKLQSVRNASGLTIERDLLFKGKYPLSIYLLAAHVAGGITKAERVLRQAAILSTCNSSSSPHSVEHQRR